MSEAFSTERRPDGGGDESTVARAMDWVVRQDRGLTREEMLQFQSWLAADSKNREHFSEALEGWRRMDRLSGVEELVDDTDAIIARARAARRFRRRVYSGLASLAAAAVLLVSLIGRPTRSAFPESTLVATAARPAEKYQILESTARRMTLSDGTIVELNGDSRIEVDFTPEERRVRLVSGEALFFVAKDAHHPFLVFAEGITVRAVGTAFDVRLAASSVEVLVTEGKILLDRSSSDSSPVAPTPSALSAGERGVMSKTPSAAPLSIGPVGSLEIDQALAWQSTRLVFDRTPLESVIVGFNRYNQHQLVLGAPELRTRTLSGVFRADNLEGFVRLLQVSSDVRAEKRSENETILFPAR